MRIKNLFFVILVTFSLNSCSSSSDPIKRYCIGFSTSSNDPIKNLELINSAIEMMKKTPEQTVFGGPGFLYKDWVDFHELMIGDGSSLDERKQVSKLLSDFCSDVLK
jgi:hypothetical protein